MSHPRTALALLLAAAATTAVALAGPAGAKTHPTVTLSPRHTDISATAAASFGFHARHLRSGSRVALQRFDKGHWSTLTRTGARHGTVAGALHAAGPGRPGSFAYRAVVTRSSRLVTASGLHRLHAFGIVPLAALCHGVLDGDCDTGRIAVDDGTTFRYVLLTGINEPSDGFVSQISAAKTSCRSLTLRYVSDDQGSDTTYLELRQPGHKAQKRTTPSNHVQTFTATLTGGRFDLGVNQDAAGVFMYFNGSGSCWTASGSR